MRFRGRQGPDHILHIRNLKELKKYPPTISLERPVSYINLRVPDQSKKNRNIQD